MYRCSQRRLLPPSAIELIRTLAAAALAALLAAPAAQAEIDRSRLVALGQSVMRVEAPRRAGGYSMGSSVKVAPDTVVTNCHVTRDASEIYVVRGPARLRVEEQASDVQRDLCLLRVPGLGGREVPLGVDAEPTPGQAVHAVGFTGGIGIQSSDGEVVALHRHEGANVIQSTNWFTSGASGGGLFDDEGRLVGILTFRLRGGEAHYFAAPVQWVRRMLQEPGAAVWRAVMPLDTPALPYWQLPMREQPRFLQASVLQRDGRWRELAALADDWLRRDADDAEPWYLFGIAAERLGRVAEARHAFECSLRLQPLLEVARTRLNNLLDRNTRNVPPPIGDRPCVPETR